jgi:hypothetical protein
VRASRPGSGARPAARDIILSLSRLSQDYPEIEEMDLNPVVADAKRCCCVDCRVVREKK